jgi:hypothetical protein
MYVINFRERINGLSESDFGNLPKVALIETILKDFQSLGQEI